MTCADGFSTRAFVSRGRTRGCRLSLHSRFCESLPRGQALAKDSPPRKAAHSLSATFSGAVRIPYCDDCRRWRGSASGWCARWDRNDILGGTNSGSFKRRQLLARRRPLRGGTPARRPFEWLERLLDALVDNEGGRPRDRNAEIADRNEDYV